MPNYIQAAKQIQTLLEKGRAGECPMGFNVVAPSAVMIEIACLFDFEWIALDLEHTLISGPQAIAELLRPAEAKGVPVLVKPNMPEPLLIRDAMDAGAHGVILPFIESADQLRELDQTLRFAPLGNRGFCPVSRSMNYATDKYTKSNPIVEFTNFVNNDMLLIPVIETLDGAENIDEILKVPGFDVFHIGMGDLHYAVIQEGEGYEYMLRLARSLCKKIHDAGKLIIGNTELMDSLDNTAKWCEAYYTHMPYVTDTSLMAYACKHSMDMAELARPKFKALLKR